MQSHTSYLLRISAIMSAATMRPPCLLPKNSHWRGLFDTTFNHFHTSFNKQSLLLIPFGKEYLKWTDVIWLIWDMFVCVFCVVFYLSTFKFNIKDVAPGRSTLTLKHFRVNLFTMRYRFPSDKYTNFTFNISQFSATESRQIALDNYNRLR